MEARQPAPAPKPRVELKPYVDILTGDSFETRAELDQAQAARRQQLKLVARAAPAQPAANNAAGQDDDAMEVDGEPAASTSAAAAAAALTDDEPAPTTPTDEAPSAQHTAALLRSKPSGTVDEPLTCPRCLDFTCSFEPNLEAHLRQCRRRALPSHVEVIYPASLLFPTPIELREALRLPLSNEGLSTVVKASRVVQNTVAAHTAFAGPSHTQLPAAASARRARPPKDSSITVPRGGSLNVTSPAGLVFSMRRDARSKRFKCPRCITYSHGNPVNFHEHVANECRAPWPTSVPAVAESKTAIRLRKPVAQASAPKAAPSAAASEGGAAAEPSEASDDDDLEDDSEEDEEDEQSVAAPSVSEAGPSGTSPFVQASTPAPPTVPHAAVVAPAVTPAALASSVAPVQAPAEPSAEPSPNVAVVAPVADVEASPSQDAAAVEAAAAPVKVELEETLPSTAPPAPVAAAPTNARGMVPRSTSSRSLRAKPKKVLKDWGSDDDDMFLASAGEDDDSDADEHVPSGQSKRKKRASTAASDGNRPGQHVLQEGEQSSWQVTCRICSPALAFSNQSVKKVHHRVYHQSMCTIGAAEPGHTIKVVRAADETFICPKCEVFANRDPVSLQTHAKNCKAIYSGPTEPPAPPPEAGSSTKKRSRKSAARQQEPAPITYDADGNPIAPPEGSTRQADGPPAVKIWQCQRCDPPLMLKSESDRAMHYRKTHQMETSITDPAGEVHIIRRSDDGFFRCLRCPGYTSRDSVLARTHIIKSCRYPWPVTPGKVDPNTVEIPSSTSSPRETKRRRKSLPGPSNLGTPMTDAGEAQGVGVGREGPLYPLSYAAGPSSYAAYPAAAPGSYAPPPASYGLQSAEYAPAVASHDPYYLDQYGAAPAAAYPHKQQADGVPLDSGTGYPAVASSYGDPSAAAQPYQAYPPYAPVSSVEASHAPMDQDRAEQYASSAAAPLASYDPGYAPVAQGPPLHEADAQPQEPPMAAPDGLQALPSQERLEIVQLIEQNQLAQQALGG